MLPGRRSNYRFSSSKVAPAPAGAAGERPVLYKVAIWLGAALFTGALVVGFFVGGRALLARVKGSGTFKLHNVVVDGNERFSGKELLKMAKLRKGDFIFDINPAQVKEALERHSRIKEARVRRVWPDSLFITVVEREARGVLMVGDLFYLVDGDGEVFERLPEGARIDRVLLTGIEEDLATGTRDLLEEELRRMLEIEERWERMGLGRYALVVEIHRESGGGIVVYADPGAREVRLGAGKYMRKMRNLKALFEHLERQGRDWDYILLDSDSFPDRLVARLR